MHGHAYGKQFDLSLKDQQFIFVEPHNTDKENTNYLSVGKKDMIFATKAQLNFCLRQLSLPVDFSEFPTFAKTRIYKPQNDP